MHTDSTGIKAAINTLIIAKVKATYEPRASMKGSAEAQATYLDELRQAVFDEVPKRLPLEDISRILDRAWKTVYRTHRYGTWPSPPEVLEAIREIAGDVVTERPRDRPPAEPIARREPFDWDATARRTAWLWEWQAAAGGERPQAVKVDSQGRITHYRMTVNGQWQPARGMAA